MPLLKVLYHAQEKNSHHIYMALIILLVLSEDDCFSKAVHEMVRVTCRLRLSKAVTEMARLCGLRLHVMCFRKGMH